MHGIASTGNTPSTIAKIRQPGTSLFIVCRQIFRETLSTFYSNNTFRITKNTYASSRDDHDKNGDYIADTMACWFNKIGTCVKLLRNIEIELGVLCPSHCRAKTNNYSYQIEMRSDGYFDIAPLLRLVWAYGIQSDIRVLQSTDTTRHDCNFISTRK